MRTWIGCLLASVLLCAGGQSRAQSQATPPSQTQPQPQPQTPSQPLLVYGPANDRPEAEKPLAERAAAAAAREKAMLEDPSKRCKREAENSKEIIVCADPDKNTRDRLPLRNETDTAKSTRTGIPRAPDLDDMNCKTHPRGACLSVGKVPPPIYYIDLSKIPEAPPGSDAERIGKGELAPP